MSGLAGRIREEEALWASDGSCQPETAACLGDHHDADVTVGGSVCIVGLNKPLWTMQLTRRRSGWQLVSDCGVGTDSKHGVGGFGNPPRCLLAMSGRRLWAAQGARVADSASNLNLPPHAATRPPVAER